MIDHTPDHLAVGLVIRGIFSLPHVIGTALYGTWLLGIANELLDSMRLSWVHRFILKTGMFTFFGRVKT